MSEAVVSKEQLYSWIISQLERDGFSTAARAVSEATLTPQLAPSNRLAQLVTAGVAAEKQNGSGLTSSNFSLDASSSFLGKDIKGIDFDEPRSDKQTLRSNFVTKFITTHKNVVRCAAFSHDGKWVATGSADTSIKVLDVQRMLQFSSAQSGNATPDDGPSGGPAGNQVRPVTKTFYDHTQSINDLAFHPFLPVIASASRDNTIKLFDYGGSQKKAHRVMQDSHNIRTIAFHPSGDYILAGTDHTVLRLYDTNTRQAYVNPQTATNHAGPVNQVAYSSDGKLFASVSKDGSLKIWDGSNSRCINTIPNAHSGMEVCSVQFSKNRKYLLTGGKDHHAKVWDIMMARPIVDIAYASTPGAAPQRLRMQTKFSYNEDYILVCDEQTNHVIVFDSRTKEQTQRLAGHNNVVRWIAVSPNEPHVLTCSDDYRGRFWVDENAVIPMPQ